MTRVHRPSEEIIDKVLEGTASAEEASLVSHWFSTEEGQCYLLQNIEKDFSSIQPEHAALYVDHEIPSTHMLETIQKNITKKRFRKILFRAAAVLLPFAILTALFFQLNSRVDLLGRSEYEELYVPKGERIQVVFQDGTKAYLNSNSRLRYPRQFSLSQRKIYLEGEAYFVVAPNEKRPFIIDLDSASIQVLGTSFNVHSYRDEPDIHVVLDEGKIDLQSRNKQSNILHPQESLVYNKANGTCLISKQEDASRFSLWKTDVISFKNEPLANVIKVLNRWYDVEFEVLDKDAYAYSFTMNSENTLLEKVLFDLEKVAPLQFTYDDNKVFIKKRMY